MIETKTSQFAIDVLNGLKETPKRLPSKYFYDKKGDKLFQDIMKLDEYYLTRTEYSIFESNKQGILAAFSNGVNEFNLIEFGAGDGYKTKVLLRHFQEEGAHFTYMPIDISGNVLRILEEALKDEMPDLHVQPKQNDYFKALKDLQDSPNRNVVLFLGSNIGNFTGDQANKFLKELNDSLNPGDLLFIGFDLKKNPDVILAAYNDSKGVTKEFNMNLLDRINHELDGHFDRSKFLHKPIYNPMTGTTSSFLVSTEKQSVSVVDETFHFEAWEAIHMEISQKYDQPMIEQLAADSGFEIVGGFTDDKKYFLNSVWRKG
ncbi:L-histidine N(alpha)-methyltransferase [Fulvivirga lutea]|uniref:L-histidine N(Alpha)-methyltransferase n=1 Tax=Fulvivirga lutea TaxID=2810512 RepID=A0A974WFP1_9BACT|nr:L-histidine N(alpha)-methyltransferase [Fulvivirga lutea]QSE97381.1 L-histidine N(alpha)-methyltransferase [Fulvivirga lutea]